jgi:hypothetical protein
MSGLVRDGRRVTGSVPVSLRCQNTALGPGPPGPPAASRSGAVESQRIHRLQQKGSPCRPGCCIRGAALGRSSTALNSSIRTRALRPPCLRERVGSEEVTCDGWRIRLEIDDSLVTGSMRLRAQHKHYPVTIENDGDSKRRFLGRRRTFHSRFRSGKLPGANKPRPTM